MTLPPIETEQQYQEALQEVVGLMHADQAAASDAGERLLALADVIEVYEAKHWPM